MKKIVIIIFIIFINSFYAYDLNLFLGEKSLYEKNYKKAAYFFSELKNSDNEHLVSLAAGYLLQIQIESNSISFDKFYENFIDRILDKDLVSKFEDREKARQEKKNKSYDKKAKDNNNINKESKEEKEDKNDDTIEDKVKDIITDEIKDNEEDELLDGEPFYTNDSLSFEDDPEKEEARLRSEKRQYEFAMALIEPFFEKKFNLDDYNILESFEEVDNDFNRYFFGGDNNFINSFKKFNNVLLEFDNNFIKFFKNITNKIDFFDKSLFDLDNKFIFDVSDNKYQLKYLYEEFYEKAVKLLGDKYVSLDKELENGLIFNINKKINVDFYKEFIGLNNKFNIVLCDLLYEKLFEDFKLPIKNYNLLNYENDCELLDEKLNEESFDELEDNVVELNTNEVADEVTDKIVNEIREEFEVRNFFIKDFKWKFNDEPFYYVLYYMNAIEHERRDYFFLKPNYLNYVNYEIFLKFFDEFINKHDYYVDHNFDFSDFSNVDDSLNLLYRSLYYYSINRSLRLSDKYFSEEFYFGSIKHFLLNRDIIPFSDKRLLFIFFKSLNELFLDDVTLRIL